MPAPTLLAHLECDTTSNPYYLSAVVYAAPGRVLARFTLPLGIFATREDRHAAVALAEKLADLVIAEGGL